MVKKRVFLLAVTLLFLFGISINILGQKDISGEQIGVPGTFTLANDPPSIVADSFGVQDDGAPNPVHFDHGTVADDGDGSNGVIDTHSVPTTALDQGSTATNFEWQTNDANQDPITTTICIATTAALRNAGTCDVVERSVSVAGGQQVLSFSHSYVCTDASCNTACDGGGGCLSQTNIIDFSGTLDTVTFAPRVAKTYYVRLTPNDGAADGADFDTQFNIVNEKPSDTITLDLSPSNDGDNLLSVDLSGNTALESCGAVAFPGDCTVESHSQTPDLIWSFSDADDGTARNKWPQDSITHISLVDSELTRDTGDFFDNTAGTDNGKVVTTTDTVSSAIPYETSPYAIDGVSRTQAFPRISVNDQHYISSETGGAQNFISANFNPDIYVADYLPNIAAPNQVTPANAGVTLQEGGGLGQLSCPSSAGAANSCTIQPSIPLNFDGTALGGTYSGLEVTIRFTDMDEDCSEGTHDLNLYLCESTATCDPSSPPANIYSFLDDDAGTNIGYSSGTGASGTPCVFTAAHAVGTSSPRTVEFFVPSAIGASAYTLNVDASSQATTPRDVDTDRDLFWELAAMPYVQYYDGPTGENWNLGDPDPVSTGSVGVLLGGGTGVGTGSFNAGTNEYILLNQGNIVRTTNWQSTQICGQLLVPGTITTWPDDCGTVLNGGQGQANDASVWILGELNTPDFEIDDDNLRAGGDAGNELATSLATVDTDFRFPPAASPNYPSGQLQLCTNTGCSAPVTSGISTFYHIWPAAPLDPDNYGSIITMTDT